MDQPVFFKTQQAFHNWLEKNHQKKDEILVGFYKVSTGKESISYKESVDEALCYGWIDGRRQSGGDTYYTIRFTPRRPRSIWSAINIKRIQELIDAGQMKNAGLEAFTTRDESKTNKYSFERKHVELPPAFLKKLQANKKAWAYFSKKPPSYQKPAIWWVISAAKEETKEKRLQQLIEDSENNRVIPPLKWQPKGKK